MDRVSSEQRLLNIANRARLLGYRGTIDLEDDFFDVSALEEYIYSKVGVEAYERADTDRSITNVLWSDGLGYDYHGSGDFVDDDFRDRTYFRLIGSKQVIVPWYDIEEENLNDYYLDLNVYVLDSNARVVGLYC